MPDSPFPSLPQSGGRIGAPDLRLHAQFGAGFKAIRQLKPTFRDALTLALAVYPEARVDLEATGVVLHPSAPAVPRTEARCIGLG
jgi:hypothetical protein